MKFLRYFSFYKKGTVQPDEICRKVIPCDKPRFVHKQVFLCLQILSILLKFIIIVQITKLLNIQI